MTLNPNSYWLKSGLYTVLERLSMVLFGFGSFFFLIRTLSKEEFGIWSIFLTVTSVLEVARSGLIQNAQIKYLASSPKEEHPMIMTASLVLNVLLTAISVAALVLFSKLLSGVWNAPVLEAMFYYYILTTIALIFHSQFNFIQQGNFDFAGIFCSNFIRQGMFFLYVFIFHFSKGKMQLIQLVNIQTFSCVLSSLISFLFVKKYLMISSRLDWKWVSKLFHFGKFVFATNLSAILFKSIDQLMLGSIVSTSSVAVFNTAVRITNLVEVPTMSAASVVFPQSAKRMATEGKEAVKFLYEKSVGLILAVVLPMIILVSLFADAIIFVVAGKGYEDVVPVLHVTILYTLFIPFTIQFGTALDSIGMPKINFYSIAFCAAITVLISYFFINHFGLMGAAYGGLTAYIVIFILNQIILSKILDVSFLNTLVYTKKFYIDALNWFIFYIRKIWVSITL